jgi:hypothetical protein
MTNDTSNRYRELAAKAHGNGVILVQPETLIKGADEIEELHDVLLRVERVLGFNLHSKIAWGDDYDQAVKDIYDATRKALGKKFMSADVLARRGR